MDPKNLYIKLLQICRNAAKDENNQLLEKEIWPSICKLAFTDINTFYSFIPLLAQISFSNPSFTESKFKEVSDAIEKTKNQLSDINERINIFAPLFALLPFLPIDDAHSIVESSIELLSDYFQNHEDDCFPEPLIGHIDTIEVASIKPQLFSDLFQLFTDKSKDKLAESTLIFAPIANSFIENIEDAALFTAQLFSKCLNQQKKPAIVAGIFLVERLSQQYSINPNYAPSDLFEKLYSHLLDNDKLIKYRCHKSMRRLIQCGIFDVVDKVKQIVDQYDKYQAQEKLLFFKLISNYLEDTESISLNTVQPIFDFAMSKISDFEISGYILSVFTSFAAIDASFIKELLKPLLLTAHQIAIQKKIIFYHDATEMLFAISKCFGNEKITIFAKDVLSMAEVLDQDESSLSLRRRTDLCQSIASLPFLDSTLEKILNFINKSIEKLNISGNSIYPLCTSIISISSKLTVEKAKDLSIRCSKLAEKETDAQRLNAILETLKTLNELIQSQSKSQNEVMADFVNQIIHGNFSYFHNLSFIVAADPKLMLFNFITILIQSNAISYDQIITEIINYLPIIPSPFLPNVSEPIMNVIDNLSNDQCKTIADSLTEVIPSFDMYTEENDEVISSFDLISSILKVHPKVVDSASLLKIIDELIQIKESNNDDENGENDADNERPMDVISLGSAMSLICQLSLHVQSVDQFEDLLLSVIDQVPFPAISNCNDSVISSLLKMYSEKDKFAKIYKQILFVFTQLLVMNNDERKSLNISIDNLNAMKAVIREAVRANSSLERELTKDFTRQMQNQFKNIVK
ncbi:hypothetical protein M9Y10_002770 [Tritrichomonas musculus]|uniref:MMS19 nucleotide excision repair protein n=1 Tax=Tritrichomonas musculus TaxID=1915356 RepID=A0ABR2LAT9_9EUKA